MPTALSCPLARIADHGFGKAQNPAIALKKSGAASSAAAAAFATAVAPATVASMGVASIGAVLIAITCAVAGTDTYIGTVAGCAQRRVLDCGIQLQQQIEGCSWHIRLHIMEAFLYCIASAPSLQNVIASGCCS